MSYQNNPPGWYHAEGDPPGSQRWWDGAKWVGGPAASGSGVSNAPAAIYPPPAYGSGITHGRPRYASWWGRLGAFLLDWMIVGVPSIIINRVTYAAVPKKIVGCTYQGRPALCERPAGGGSAVYVGVIILTMIAGLAYYVYFHGKSGQTIGKKAVGIAVADIRTGAPIGTGRAIGRSLGAIISWISCALGYLWAAWDKDKQTWHDKMVSSVVVYKDN